MNSLTVAAVSEVGVVAVAVGVDMLDAASRDGLLFSELLFKLFTAAPPGPSVVVVLLLSLLFLLFSFKKKNLE
jgi:hypothetical protein